MLSRVLVAGLLALLGLAVATQVQTRGGDESLEAYREEDLIALVDGLDGSIRRTRAELARVRATRQQLREGLAEDELVASRAEERAAPLERLAGLEPVRGPGLRITIADPAGEVGFDLVVDLLQDLRAAGADAIEVDDRVRLGTDSWVSGLGGGITVDGADIPRPYRLEVVGEPATLAGALAFPRGGADRMRDQGARVTYEEAASLDVSTVRDLPAQPRAEPTGPAL